MTSSAPEFVSDRAHQQTSQPGVEAGDVAERSEIAPAPNERLLDGVLGAIGVTKDEARNRVQPVDDRSCEDVEGLALAVPGPSHESGLIGAHASPLRSELSHGWRFTPYRRGRGRKRSLHTETGLLGEEARIVIRSA